MIIVLMGVAGSGKTTVGQALATHLEWEFLEGDQLHSPENRAKMARGQALSDEERRPWLLALATHIRSHLRRKSPLVVACSALKASYRTLLLVSADVKLVYLRADQTLIEKRLKERPDHFFPPQLIASQFATLEEPKEALILSSCDPLPHLIAEICAHFGL